MPATGLSRVKTIEALLVQCIFGHVGSISRPFVDSNRALSNLHGKWFGFSHGLGQTRSPMAPDSVPVYRWIDVNVYRKSTGRVTATR
jgi:hypothetical protein